MRKEKYNKSDNGERHRRRKKKLQNTDDEWNKRAKSDCERIAMRESDGDEERRQQRPTTTSFLLTTEVVCKKHILAATQSQKPVVQWTVCVCVCACIKKARKERKKKKRKREKPIYATIYIMYANVGEYAILQYASAAAAAVACAYDEHTHTPCTKDHKTIRWFQQTKLSGHGVWRIDDSRRCAHTISTHIEHVCMCLCSVCIIIIVDKICSSERNVRHA